MCACLINSLLSLLLMMEIQEYFPSEIRRTHITVQCGHSGENVSINWTVASLTVISVEYCCEVYAGGEMSFQLYCPVKAFVEK